MVRECSIYCCCWASVYVLVTCWGGGDVRNNCHLAANSGTNPRVVFLGGVGPLSFRLGRCEVVFENYFRVSLLSAASSYIDDTAHTEN